jgi:hypothetical protein
MILNGLAGSLQTAMRVWLVNGLPLTFTPTSITRSGSTATLTFSIGHGYTTGMTTQIFVAGATQTEYNGLFTATVTSNTVVTYTVSGTPATPATGTITFTDIVSVTRSGSVVTVQLGGSAPHGLAAGTRITVSGATETDYNVTVNIDSVPSLTSFTYILPSGTPATPATGLPTYTITSAGWTEPYTSGTTSVFKPASGPQHYLRVQDDASLTGLGRVAIVRAGEGHAGGGVLIDPYPTLAQSADTTTWWAKSATADSTVRGYNVAVDDSVLHYLPSLVPTAGWLHPPHVFGYFYPFRPTDISYNSMITVSNSASVTTTNIGTNNSTLPAGFWGGTVSNANVGYAARSPDGMVKSTRVLWSSSLYTYPGGAGAAYPNNQDAKLMLTREGFIYDIYSTSGSASSFGNSPRGVFANMYWPWIAAGYTSLTSRDSLTVSYLGSDVKMIFVDQDIASNATYFRYCFQITGTVTPPSW